MPRWPGSPCGAKIWREHCPPTSEGMLTTVGWTLADGATTYALEGAVFVTGAAVQWLRDGLGIVKQASETGPLAEAADESQEVYLVPAFVGLGAPYWNSEVRGAMFGLTRNSGPKEFARAALESIAVGADRKLSHL